MNTSKTKSHRLFIALWPDDASRTQIYEWQQAMLHCDTSYRPGRPIARENLHLTLCFLGDVTQPQMHALCSALDAVVQPAFELQLQTPGYFKRPQIAWLGLKRPAPALAQFVMWLNNIVSGVLPEYHNQQNDFIAHVSLFRHAQGVPGCGTSEADVPDCICWPVHDFALVESLKQPAGVVYRVLQRWPLA